MPKQVTEQQEKSAAEDPLSSEVAKHLTHVEASVREKTVQRIIKYLRLREKTVGKVEDIEFQKLWKALYYCFWLTDKVAVQMEMAETLSQLSRCFQRMENVNSFFANYFFVLRREWMGIDYLRMNKYAAWIRQMVHEWFVALSTHGFSDGNVQTFVECVREQVLLPIQADGLRMQVAFVYLPELASVAGGTLDEPIFRELLSPFLCVLIEQTTEAFFQAVMKDVFEPLIENQFQRPDQEFTSFKNLNLYKLGTCIFDMAAADESLGAQRRKALYAMAKKMEAQARKEGVFAVEDKPNTPKRARSASMQQPAELPVAVAASLEQDNKKRARANSVVSNGSDTQSSAKKPLLVQASSSSSVAKTGKKKEETSKVQAVLQKMLKPKKGEELVEAAKRVFGAPREEDEEEEDQPVRAPLSKPAKTSVVAAKPAAVPEQKKNAPKTIEIAPAAAPIVQQQKKNAPKTIEVAVPEKKKAEATKPVASEKKAEPIKPVSSAKKEPAKEAGKAKNVGGDKKKAEQPEEEAAAEQESNLNESVLSTASSTTKKNVRFSHKDIMRIPAINKRMKESHKTAAELGKPTKSLLKKSSNTSM